MLQCVSYLSMGRAVGIKLAILGSEPRIVKSAKSSPGCNESNQVLYSTKHCMYIVVCTQQYSIGLFACTFSLTLKASNLNLE